jgi:hypothetical protein
LEYRRSDSTNNGRDDSIDANKSSVVNDEDLMRIHLCAAQGENPVYWPMDPMNVKMVD